MSAIAAPYGLKPVKLLGNRSYAGSIREYPMTTNASAGIFCGDLVGLSAGTIVPITATPTTTWGAGTTPVGVCVGVRYTDASSKQEVHSQFFPAGGITAGHTKVFIKVVDDPDCIFQMQATGAVTAAKLNFNATVILTTAGSTVTGVSGMALNGTTAATATLAMRIVGFVELAGKSTVGDAFTDCYVMFNPGVHAFRCATGG